MNKTLKYIIGTIIILVIASCFEVVENRTPATNKESVLQNDTLMERNDTLLLAKVINEGKAAILKWGIKGGFLNTSIDTFQYQKNGFDKIYKGQDVFVIKDGCGTGCSFMYLMEVKENTKGSLFYSPLLIDIEKGIVCYQGERTDALVTLENIRTKKELSIKEQFDITQRPLALAIDSISLEGDQLYLSWKGVEGSHSKKIDIKSLY